ncbi:ribosomal protein S5-alanine N-acetyltransferase [Vibrio ziniensis]|uniref:ribosomal protein S5-alanine N-acetyltransferase n=1 Tax=Vibrio ziniensis TaxID=2711221 RepID=UPI001FE3C0AD|nr:ribosomal protein S5-alanine N-acetyltransferase [Vibrio ziniensis]
MESNSTPTSVCETDGEILLVTAQLSDAERIAQYFRDNREHLKPWDPVREDAFFTTGGWQQRLLKLSEVHKLSLGFYLLIIDIKTDKMLGTISFSNLNRFPIHTCNVGYSLAHIAQGKGTMTRALQMACNYMFSFQNMHRIMAAYIPRNKRSESVLERVGFLHEGHAKDYILIDGKWEDHNLMSLINAYWKEE